MWGVFFVYCVDLQGLKYKYVFNNNYSNHYVERLPYSTASELLNIKRQGTLHGSYITFLEQ